jgi:CubicO group peptidase (beta-lactamase class C family)
MTSCARHLLVTLILLHAVFTPLASTAVSPDGHWEGSIEIPGSTLAIDVDLKASDQGSLSGDISIPAQMAKDLPLTNLTWNGAEVVFEISGVPGTPTFKGTLAQDGSKIGGTFTQGGQAFPFALERKAAPAAAAKSSMEGFDAFVEKAIADWEIPGLAVSIVRGGETAYAKGFGKRDLAKDLPVTTKTVFAIGSSTKAFTTFVMGTLVDEGKLEWDKPVHLYLPEFRLYDVSASERITPRDLVTHRSGLPRHDALWYNTTLSRAEMVARLPYLQNNADLRERFQYNNMMFLSAGYLIERLTGKSWEDCVRERILLPLGMTSTNFSVEDSQKAADFSKPYDKRDDKLQEIPFRNITNVGPAGSINSNVEDMSRWISLHLGGKTPDGKTLIGKETLAGLHAPQMVTSGASERPDIVPVGYAIGWFVDVYRGHLRVQHGGAIDGFGALVVLFPNDDLGMVVLQNYGYNGFPEMLVRHAADRILGLEPVDWNADGLAKRKLGKEAGEEAEKKKTTVRKPGTTPSHPLEQYAGSYANPGYGKTQVTLDRGALRVTYNSISAPLEHWHYDVFNAGKDPKDPTLEDAKILFRTNVKGNIDALLVSLEPAVPDIVFTKEPAAHMTDPAWLSRFLGEYELAGQVLTAGLQGSMLTLSVPGQPLYELTPDLDDEFNLKIVSGYSLKFEVDKSGNPTAMILMQPNGVFTAKRR